MSLKSEPKPWWESKTIWLNAAFGVLAVAQATTDALKPFLPPEALGGVLAVVAAANVALRVVTGQPVCSTAKPKGPTPLP